MICAGLGLNSAVTADELAELLAQAPQRPEQIAILRSKQTVQGFTAFASLCPIKVIALDETEIVGEQVLTHSERVFARFGTGSVAEALALVAARLSTEPPAQAQLLGPRLISSSGHATLALAATTPAETQT
ncbi:Cobalamin biosynthesis protein CbiG [Tritonibacter multivorans]|uniref:Cobalamin biosynthesis protein CbiG n=1 Tax=Tritonibacter multivorans TaxID=928856 RepID=A0A0P1G182_9RHOB|nr:Cobalamin biosynthesis protein CbiG [Tritonibacter multivorans]SFD20806.1 cobalt-precorrin 5A hydrolase [Tritonibacter multivorans]